MQLLLYAVCSSAVAAVDVFCCADNGAGSIRLLAEALQAGMCPSLQHLNIWSEFAVIGVVLVVWAAGVLQWNGCCSGMGAKRSVLAILTVIVYQQWSATGQSAVLNACRLLVCCGNCWRVLLCRQWSRVNQHPSPGRGAAGWNVPFTTASGHQW